MNGVDTKLKNTNKPIKLNIIAMLIFVITSFGIISLYPLIKESGKNNHSSSYGNYDILKRINQTSYTLYKDILEKQSSKELTYDEAYVKSHKDSGKYNDFKNNLNNQLEEWNEYFVRSLKNLDYLAYDNDIAEGKTNTGNKLSELVNTMDNKELNDAYDFYMVVHYDGNGEAEVTNVHGADEYTVRNRFSEFSFKRSFDNNLVEENEVRFNPIKNATFVYAIPKELKYEDNISVLVNHSLNNINIHILTTIVIAILCSILILGLMVPYKKGKEIFGIKIFLKIPLEIDCIIFTFGAVFSGIGSFYAICSTLEGSFGDGWIGFGINPELDIWLIGIINIIIWFIIIYLIFAGDMLLKHIFKIGIIKYFKENLIIIKILKGLKKLIKY
jgi:hypothetical protein